MLITWIHFGNYHIKNYFRFRLENLKKYLEPEERYLYFFMSASLLQIKITNFAAIWTSFRHFSFGKKNSAVAFLYFPWRVNIYKSNYVICFFFFNCVQNISFNLSFNLVFTRVSEKTTLISRERGLYKLHIFGAGIICEKTWAEGQIFNVYQYFNWIYERKGKK